MKSLKYVFIFEIQNKVWNQIKNQVGDQAKSQVWNQVEDQVVAIMPRVKSGIRSVLMYGVGFGANK